MRRTRSILLAVLALIIGGSLLLNLGLAWYWRSAWYCSACAEVASDSLQLPVEIESTFPRSWRSREFRDVRVWLPQHRDEVAWCQRVRLICTPTTADPLAYELHLFDGRSEVSTRTWLREDYRFLLESGLRPGFDPDGPRRVLFQGMDVVFERAPFQATLSDAGGVVDFGDPQLGTALITCDTFNGHRSAEPVTLYAVFSPQVTGIQLDSVELTVPKMPIAIVGLDQLVGLQLECGTFAGHLTYRETATDRELDLSGVLRQVELPELTAGLLPQPWRGSAPELQLRSFKLRNGQPECIAFSGLLTDVILGDVLALWGLEKAGGRLRLRLHDLDLTPDGIQRLVLSGRCEDLSLEELSTLLGWGNMAGRARLVIDDLTITDNQLARLDATITVSPTDGGNWIERQLVSHILEQAFGIVLPEFLPERFEYVQLGLHIEVRDEMLYLFGTHGPDERTILTVSVAGRDLPVINEPEEPIDLHPWCSRLRERLAGELGRRWQGLREHERWGRYAPQLPATQPAGPPAGD